MKFNRHAHGGLFASMLAYGARFGGLFGGGSPSVPPPPPPPPSPEDPRIDERRRAERQALRRRRGRNATILTSPLGDTSEPLTTAARLLGGGS